MKKQLLKIYIKMEINIYIYKTSKSISVIKLNLSKNQNILRLLENNYDQVKLCYNADEMLLKKQSIVSCFYITDDYNF